MAAISVDLPSDSRNLRAKRGYTFTILSDPDAAVIKRYDLLHPKAGPDEHDVARPAEFFASDECPCLECLLRVLRA